MPNTPQEYSPRGIPIVSLDTKLKNLQSCFGEGSFEDAAGHLCDLLEYCRLRIPDDMGRVFKDLPSLIAYYGKCPTEVKDN